MYFIFFVFREQSKWFAPFCLFLKYLAIFLVLGQALSINIYSEPIKKDIVKENYEKYSSRVAVDYFHLKNENGFSHNAFEAKKIYSISPSFYWQNNNFLVDASADISSGGNKDVKFWLGENFQILASPFENAIISVGRRKFYHSNLLLDGMKDGAEGLTAIFLIEQNLILSLVLYDQYGGYKLFSYDKFKSDKYFEPVYDRFTENTNGYRTRHGAVLENKTDNYYAEFHFLYMNLGNWGLYANDLDRAPSVVGEKDQKEALKKDVGQLGDGDYIIHSGTSLSWKMNPFTLKLMGEFSRGIDYTEFNRSTNRRNIPFAGELFMASFAYEKNHFNTSLTFFMPDSDAKKKSSKFDPVMAFMGKPAKGDTEQIMGYGYIGKGNLPMNNSILSDSLDFIPAAWITAKGAEKNQAIDGGRRNSFFMQGLINYEYRNAAYGFSAKYILPYKNERSIGDIGLNRRDYAGIFLFEPGISVTIQMNELRINILYSHLYASKTLNISGDSLRISAQVNL